MVVQLIFSFCNSHLALELAEIAPGSVICFGSGFDGLALTCNNARVTPLTSDRVSGKVPILEFAAPSATLPSSKKGKSTGLPTSSAASPRVEAPSMRQRTINVHEGYVLEFVTVPHQFEDGSTSASATASVPSTKSQRRNINRRIKKRIEKQIDEAKKVGQTSDVGSIDAQSGG